MGWVKEHGRLEVNIFSFKTSTRKNVQSLISGICEFEVYQPNYVRHDYIGKIILMSFLDFLHYHELHSCFRSASDKRSISELHNLHSGIPGEAKTMTSVLLVGAACARRRCDNTSIIQARTRTVVLQVFWAIQGRFYNLKVAETLEFIFRGMKKRRRSMANLRGPPRNRSIFPSICELRSFL